MIAKIENGLDKWDIAKNLIMAQEELIKILKSKVESLEAENKALRDNTNDHAGGEE